MKYGIRLKAYLKKIDKELLYDNKYINAKVNATKFENRVLKDNRRCNISIESKNGSRYEYLFIILLDSILIYSNSDCSNKYYPQIFLKKCMYVDDK